MENIKNVCSGALKRYQVSEEVMTQDPRERSLEEESRCCGVCHSEGSTAIFPAVWRGQRGLGNSCAGGDRSWPEVTAWVNSFTLGGWQIRLRLGGSVKQEQPASLLDCGEVGSSCGVRKSQALKSDQNNSRRWVPVGTGQKQIWS